MEWLSYLLKVSACTALFYAFYYFCLQRLTFFSVNRIYLLSTLIISFVIPALQLEVQRSADERSQVREVTAVYTGTFPELPNSGAAIQSYAPQTEQGRLTIDWTQVLFVSYWLIAVSMLLIFAFQALQLLKHTRQVNQKIGRLRVVFKQDGFTNCSFLNYVFLNRKELSDEEMAVILHHENVHICRYHSVDKMIIAICKALLWFNPLIYLYDKALAQIHEYEADKETSAAIGSTSYASILLAMAVRKNNPSLTHSFVRNPLKGRIKMLFTNPSKKMKKLMYLAALPIGLILIWTFAVQVVYASFPATVPEQTLKPTQVKPVQGEKESRRNIPFKELKTKKPTLLVLPSDTLWMVGSRDNNRYSEVIIDGKSYAVDILTRISPSCLKSIAYGGDKIDITTKNNKIEYATKIDRENAIARNKARASGKSYIRYAQKNQDGSRYDYIEIKTKGGAGGGVSLDKEKKLLLIYEGKQYSERKFKALTNDQLINRGMRFSSFDEPKEEINVKYGKGYGSMIEIFEPEETIPSDTISLRPQSGQKKIFRKPMGLEVEDGYGKFSYSARDSTIYNEGLRFATLYGDVKMGNGKLQIAADKIRFDGANHIALAQNASFTVQGKGKTIIADFVKFDLRKGTYQILTSKVDF
jgi:hypothetical protein